MLTLEPDEALPTSKFMHGPTDISTGMSFINNNLYVLMH